MSQGKELHWDIKEFLNLHDKLQRQLEISELSEEFEKNAKYIKAKFFDLERDFAEIFDYPKPNNESREKVQKSMCTNFIKCACNISN